jgi:crooked neck
MPELYRCYIAFEKKFGCKDGIEDAIVGKRRLQYEEALAAAPHDYDTWYVSIISMKLSQHKDAESSSLNLHARIKACT